MAQHETSIYIVRKNVYPKQTTTILSEHATFLLGQGPTYAIIFAYKRVAPEHLVSLADIAERVSMTRQAISLLIQGRRGSGDFPKPILKISNKSPLWRWSSVAKWLYQHGKIQDHDVVDSANVVEDINAALELRNMDSFEHQRMILNELENSYTFCAESKL